MASVRLNLAAQAGWQQHSKLCTSLHSRGRCAGLSLRAHRSRPRQVVRFPTTEGVHARTTQPHTCKNTTFASEKRSTVDTVQNSTACRASSTAASTEQHEATGRVEGVYSNPLDWVVAHLKWVWFVGTAIPIWVFQGALALLGMTLAAKLFFKRVDRSGIDVDAAVPGIEHNFVTVNGIRLHVATAGKAPGKPLMLFLHGFPEIWYSWRHQLSAFKEDYEVAAIDLRGYGQSDKPREGSGYWIDHLVADVVGVISALDHKSCTLVAHDWGGMLAWYVAALHPEAVEKLVQVAIPHPLAWDDNLDWDQRRRSWYFRMFYCPGLPEFLVAAADKKVFDGLAEGKMAFRSGTPTAEEIEIYKAAFPTGKAFRGPMNYYRRLCDNMTRKPTPAYVRARSRLKAGLDVPTLMLYAGNDSALGPQLLKGTHKYLSNLELHELENCSHWAQQDKPEEVTKLMKAFLAPSA